MDEIYKCMVFTQLYIIFLQTKNPSKEYIVISFSGTVFSSNEKNIPAVN
jgi:hypothetical protein